MDVTIKNDENQGQAKVQLCSLVSVRVPLLNLSAVRQATEICTEATFDPNDDCI